MWETLIASLPSAIAGILTGGGIVAYFQFRSNKRSTVDASTADLLNRYEKENAELRAANAKMQERLTSLEVKVVLLEASTYDIPFPMWLKDLDGTMLSLNPEYERVFLLPMGKTTGDYVGNKDEDVWGEAIAENYRSHDLQVLRTKREWIGVEEIPINGIIEKWKIVKFPRFVGTTLVGIGGMAFPLEDSNFK
jgi:hypothetical protein